MELNNPPNPPAEIQPQEVLIAAGLNPQYNYKQRESSWYGLWIVVLRVFETVTGCHLHAQYELFTVGDEEDMRSEYHPSPSFNPRSAPTTPITTRSTKRGQGRLYSGTSLSTPTSARSILAVEEQSEIDIPHMIGANVLYGNFITSPSPSTPKNTSRIMSPSSNIATPSGSVDDNLKESHRIPDFVICHYLSQREDIIQVAKRPNINISRRVIPIIIEVKNYRCREDDHDSRASVAESYSKLGEAIDGLKVQVQHLFSLQSYEGTQAAVIAIAASGFFWSWIQYRNDDGEPVPNMAFNPINEVYMHWSRRYEIGTEASDNMFAKIRNWAENFVANPDVENPAIIQEPAQ